MNEKQTTLAPAVRGVSTHKSTTVSFTDAAEQVLQSDIVRGRIHADGHDPAASQFEIAMIDGHGRMVDRLNVPAASDASFELSSSDVRTLTARVVVKLTDRQRAACETYKSIPVARELDDKDYLVGIWASYFPLTCGRPWSHYLIRHFPYDLRPATPPGV